MAAVVTHATANATGRFKMNVVEVTRVWVTMTVTSWEDMKHKLGKTENDEMFLIIIVMPVCVKSQIKCI